MNQETIPDSVDKFINLESTDERAAFLCQASNAEVLEIFLDSCMLEELDKHAEELLGIHPADRKEAFSNAEAELIEELRAAMIVDEQSEGGEFFDVHGPDDDRDFTDKEIEKLERLEAAYVERKKSLAHKLVELGFYVKPTIEEVKALTKKTRKVVVSGLMDPKTYEDLMKDISEQEEQSLRYIVEH